MYYQLRD